VGWAQRSNGVADAVRRGTIDRTSAQASEKHSRDATRYLKLFPKQAGRHLTTHDFTPDVLATMKRRAEKYARENPQQAEAQPAGHDPAEHSSGSEAERAG
jgi:hypothetical protein